ncbi:MAG: DMT family transporter [Bacillota bacterium]
MKGHLPAYLALAAGMALAGSTVVVGKMVTSQMPVFLGSSIRYGVAAVILLPLAVRLEGAQLGLPPGRRDRRRVLGALFLQSLFGNFLFSICLLYGLRFASAADGAVVTSLTPAVIGLLSVLFLRERLGWVKGGGLVLATVGVISLQLSSGAAGPAGPAATAPKLLGLAFLLGAVLSEAAFTVVGKALSSRISPLPMSALSIGMGTLTLLPFALVEQAAFDWSTVPPATWFALLYYGLFGTVASYLLWYWGVARVEAGVAGVFTAVLPVAALALSAAVLGESLTAAHLLGVLLVLGAIALTTRSSGGERRLSRRFPDAGGRISPTPGQYFMTQTMH